MDQVKNARLSDSNTPSVQHQWPETVMLQYADGNLTRWAPDTPASDRSSFTLTGLQSEIEPCTLIVSCAAGQENNGSHGNTVK